MRRPIFGHGLFELGRSDRCVAYLARRELAALKMFEEMHLVR
jgi:hypothetical protein